MEWKLQNEQRLQNQNFGLIHPLLERLKSVIDFDSIKVIYDIGSRDALQSIEFSRCFPNAKIYAFEANPESVVECKKNIDSYQNKNIQLFSCALSNVTGDITFNAIDMEKSRDKNIGASSIFKVMDSLPFGSHWVQKEITVPSFRLDDIVESESLPVADLIWMDVQGAEHLVLQGALETIKKCRVVFTEAGLRAYYHGHGMFDDVNILLVERGFKVIDSIPGHEFESDFLYIKDENI